MQSASDILSDYFDAAYPLVALETVEESRLLNDVVSEKKMKWKKVFSVAATGGLKQHEATTTKVVDLSASPTKAFQIIAKEEDALLLVFDYHHMISSPQAYRPLLQAIPSLKSNGLMIVLVAPFWSLPPELKHEIPVINLPLPTAEDLKSSLKTVLNELKYKPEIDEDEVSQLARGLTMAQAENVFALSSLIDKRFNKETVEREKMRLVKSKSMTVQRSVSPDSLGGLGRLKEYITSEVMPVKDDPQLQVRGILLVGVPGGGKSLCAKAISAILGWPLVRWDMSAAKGSLQGQSEAQVRHDLALADAIAPCVLWWDEVEKSAAGLQSSGATDGGTKAGMIGHTLTWMQEHDSPVFVVATCNDFQSLPSELTRAGRFDEKFFVDLPTYEEREAIAYIHLNRFKIKYEVNFAAEIAERTDSWTGAEIEQLIKSMARRSKRNLEGSIGEKLVTSCSQEIIPISKTSNIQKLRDWAKTNLRPANDSERMKIPISARRVRTKDVN